MPTRLRTVNHEKLTNCETRRFLRCRCFKEAPAAWARASNKEKFPERRKLSWKVFFTFYLAKHCKSPDNLRLTNFWQKKMKKKNLTFRIFENFKVQESFSYFTFDVFTKDKVSLAESALKLCLKPCGHHCPKHSRQVVGVMWLSISQDASRK